MYLHSYDRSSEGIKRKYSTDFSSFISFHCELRDNWIVLTNSMNWNYSRLWEAKQRDYYWIHCSWNLARCHFFSCLTKEMLNDNSDFRNFSLKMKDNQRILFLIGFHDFWKRKLTKHCFIFNSKGISDIKSSEDEKK